MGAVFISHNYDDLLDRAWRSRPRLQVRLSINDYVLACDPMRWAAVEAAVVTLREAGFTGLVSLDLDEEHEQ
jgi:hypothetical protein